MNVTYMSHLKTLSQEWCVAVGRTSKNTAAEFAQRCSDAEKEVIKVTSKMQETTTNLLKYQRDRDCKLLTAN